MIARDCGLGMGLGRLSRLHRGVGVQTMSDTGLDKTRHVESGCDVPLDSHVLRLHVPSVAVGVIIGHRCVVDRVEVTCGVISAMRELSSEDERVEF